MFSTVFQNVLQARSKSKSKSKSRERKGECFLCRSFYNILCTLFQMINVLFVKNLSSNKFESVPFIQQTLEFSLSWLLSSSLLLPRSEATLQQMTNDKQNHKRYFHWYHYNEVETINTLSDHLLAHRQQNYCFPFRCPFF